MGFLWLGTVPLTSGLVGQIFGVRYMSTLFGIVFLSHQVGSFFGAWGAGYIFNRTGSYDLAWQLSIGIALLAAVLCWSRASVLAASAGAERLNIMHAASAAEAARRAKIFRFIGVPPLRKLLRGGYALRYFDYLTLYRILEANLRESP
jgi:hypothetical protein